MKILFGSIVVDARGRLNGHVFKKTAFGNSITALALPRSQTANAGSSQQQYLSQVLRWYSTLDSAERSAWNLFASQNPIKNKFGVPRNIGGRAMFVMCTWNLNNPPIERAQGDELVSAIPANLYNNFSVNASTGMVSITCVMFVDEMLLPVYVQTTSMNVDSPPQNRWQRIDNLLFTATGVKTSLTDIRTFDRINLVNHKVWVRIKLCNASSFGTEFLTVQATLT